MSSLHHTKRCHVSSPGHKKDVGWLFTLSDQDRKGKTGSELKKSFPSDVSRELLALLTWHGEAREQVAQSICTCPIPGNAPDKLRWGTEHPDGLSGVGTGWDLKSLLLQAFLWFLGFFWILPTQDPVHPLVLQCSPITFSFTKSTSALHQNYPPSQAPGIPWSPVWLIKKEFREELSITPFSINSFTRNPAPHFP